MIDCSQCTKKPTLAQANVEGGEGMYCPHFDLQPQSDNCMMHSRYDAAKKAGNARVAATRITRMPSPEYRGDAGDVHSGPSGSYLYL